MFILHPENMFGFFGKEDVEFEVREIRGRTDIRIQCYDPVDGRNLGGGNGPPDGTTVTRTFGPGFKFR